MSSVCFHPFLYGLGNVFNLNDNPLTCNNDVTKPNHEAIGFFNRFLPYSVFWK